MKPKRPVRALVLTSIRDVGACDLNGCTIPTKSGLKYMKGLVEYAVRDCCPGGSLHGFLDIVGVVTDDLPKNLEGSAYPLVPTPGKQWIHGLDLTDRCGEKVCGQTVHIPSKFRQVPNAAVVLKREAKREFEGKVFAHMRAIGADIIVSDHYMGKIEFLIGELGLYGRVVNCHPAITDKRHDCCMRGKTPTADAIARAKSGKPTVTGATLHLVNAEFDDGPIIECMWPTPVRADDSPAELRYRNYQMAKFPVFTRGMQEYVTKVF